MDQRGEKQFTCLGECEGLRTLSNTQKTITTTFRVVGVVAVLIMSACFVYPTILWRDNKTESKELTLLVMENTKVSAALLEASRFREREVSKTVKAVEAIQKEVSKHDSAIRSQAEAYARLEQILAERKDT